jgi:uncharacterized protein YjiK
MHRISTDAKKEGNKKSNGKDKADENESGSGITIIKKSEVPDVLKEVSGLSYIGDNTFGTVQDERGSVFIYNTSTGKIQKEIPFAGKGDYEDIAIVKNDAFILASNGRIFEIKNYNSNPTVIEHKTHLTAKQDAEGLCHDSKANRLLVAIKGDDNGSKNYKGIYAFNLSTRSMPAEPVYRIDLSDEMLGGKKDKKGSYEINPSGVAINPLNGDIYITEGTKPKLLILDRTGKIKTLIKLNSRDFNQPEGITFSPDGRIFISNEGTKDPGNILEIKGVL